MKKNSFFKILPLVFAIVTIILCTGCSSGDFSEKDARTIAENGFQAMKNRNSAEIVKYTNVDLLYYAANHKHLTDEELIRFIDSLIADSDENYNALGIIGFFSALENVDFYDIQLFPSKETDALNTFIIDQNMLGESGDFNYIIEKAYKLKTSYTGSETESTENGNEPYVLVIYANGEWKLDIYISILKDLYDSLSQFK